MQVRVWLRARCQGCARLRSHLGCHVAEDMTTNLRSSDEPSVDDWATATALDQALPSELAAVRERGKNWIGALTALTGLIAVVTVLKGPETTSDLVWWYRLIVALLCAGGLILLVLGVRSAYTAAY